MDKPAILKRHDQLLKNILQTHERRVKRNQNDSDKEYLTGDMLLPPREMPQKKSKKISTNSYLKRLKH